MNIIRVSVPLILKLSSNRSFKVQEMTQIEIIINLPWLSEVDPDIDWSKGEFGYHRVPSGL